MSLVGRRPTITTTADLHHTIIGRDREGYFHHHDTESGRMHVIHPDGDRETHAVDDDEREKWKAFVKIKRGWEFVTNRVTAKDIFGDGV